MVGTTADGYAITEDDTPVTVKESGGRRVFSSVPNNTTVTLGLKHDLQGFFGSVAFASFDDNATEEQRRDAVREANVSQGKRKKLRLKQRWEMLPLILARWILPLCRNESLL